MPTDIVTRYGNLFDGTLGCMAREVRLETDPPGFPGPNAFVLPTRCAES